MAPVLKILGVPRLPPGGSLGTGKRGTVPKIWRAVPIFLVRVNGVSVSLILSHKPLVLLATVHALLSEVVLSVLADYLSDLFHYP